jgi:hypothetical protein
MPKYQISFADPVMAIPVEMAQETFDPFDYTRDRFYLWRDGNVHFVEFYFRFNDYNSIQDQPAAKLIRFVASQMSVTAEHGIVMIVDSDHMYLDPGHDFWFDDSVPFDQQGLVVAGEVARELFFSAWRMLGWSINQID